MNLTKISNEAKAAIILLLAFGLRYVLLFNNLSGHEYIVDNHYYYIPAVKFLDNYQGNFMQVDFIDTSLLLAFFYGLFIKILDFQNPLMERIVFIEFFNICFLLIFYLTLSKITKDRFTIFVSIFVFILSSVFLYISSMTFQSDVILLCFIMLPVYFLLTNKKTLFSIFIFIPMLVKPQTTLFFPIYFYFICANIVNIRSIIISITSILVILLLFYFADANLQIWFDNSVKMLTRDTNRMAFYLGSFFFTFLEVFLSYPSLSFGLIDKYQITGESLVASDLFLLMTKITMRTVWILFFLFCFLIGKRERKKNKKDNKVGRVDTETLLKITAVNFSAYLLFFNHDTLRLSIYPLAFYVLLFAFDNKKYLANLLVMFSLQFIINMKYTIYFQIIYQGLKDMDVYYIAAIMLTNIFYLLFFYQIYKLIKNELGKESLLSANQPTKKPNMGLGR